MVLFNFHSYIKNYTSYVMPCLMFLLPVLFQLTRIDNHTEFGVKSSKNNKFTNPDAFDNYLTVI